MERKTARTFIEEVASLPGGEKVNECIQCGVCSGSCTTVEKWEYTPRRIIAMVRAEMKEEVLSSNSIWNCATCYLCTVRCPRDIKPADIMCALQNLAIKEKIKPKYNRTPILYQTFAEILRKKGRIPELSLILRFSLRTDPFGSLSRMPLGLSLLTHGRLPLRTKEFKKKQEIEAILNKVKQLAREVG